MKYDSTKYLIELNSIWEKGLRLIKKNDMDMFVNENKTSQWSDWVHFFGNSEWGSKMFLLLITLWDLGNNTEC